MRRVALASFGALSKKKASFCSALAAHAVVAGTAPERAAPHVPWNGSGRASVLLFEVAKERNGSNMASILRYAGVALAAAAAGAAVGLLFAPAPGVVTRRRLAYRIDEKRLAISERGRAMRDTVTGRRERLSAVVNG